VSLLLLIAVVANGCASLSFSEVRRRADPHISSRSDRLRGGLAQASPPLQVPEPSGRTTEMPTPGRQPEPAAGQNRAQPQQPAGPLDRPPAQGGEEPDPRAVIDWLL